MRQNVVLMLVAVFGYCIPCPDVQAVDAYPTAPTIADAHHYFESLIVNNGVSALYETKSRSGDVLGFERFQAQEYSGVTCNSVVVLKNGVRIAINWAVVEKSQLVDSTLSILQGQNIQFLFFHMISLEGGIVVEPSNAIPRLFFAINDEVSRNRLLKAVDLLSSACRAKSKFD